MVRRRYCKYSTAAGGFPQKHAAPGRQRQTPCRTGAVEIKTSGHAHVHGRMSFWEALSCRLQGGSELEGCRTVQRAAGQAEGAPAEQNFLQYSYLTKQGIGDTCAKKICVLRMEIPVSILDIHAARTVVY